MAPAFHSEIRMWLRFDLGCSVNQFLSTQLYNIGVSKNSNCVYNIILVLLIDVLS